MSKILDDLVQRCEDPATQERLNEIVFEVSCQIGATVTNQGVRAEWVYLMDQCGVTEATKLVQELLEETPKKDDKND